MNIFNIIPIFILRQPSTAFLASALFLDINLVQILLGTTKICAKLMKGIYL